jgi:hypothetical protein
MEWWGNSEMLGDGAPFLDRFPGAYRAYSLQLLRTGVPHVAQVRRSSDNALQNVSATEITDGTLTSWVGAGNNGFVVRLYDQQRLVNNASDPAVQLDSTRQPQIVAAGALITTNGKPAMRLNGTSSYMIVPSIGSIAMNAFNVSVVAKSDIATSSFGFGVTDPNRILVPNIGGTPTTMNVGYAGSNLAFVFGSTGITDQVLWQLNAGAAQANAWRNGVASTPVASSSVVENFASVNLAIGTLIRYGAPITTAYWNGTFQELIIYGSDKAADVAAHAAAINSRYNIF